MNHCVAEAGGKPRRLPLALRPITFEGSKVLNPKSKTDQEGLGQHVAIINQGAIFLRVAKGNYLIPNRLTDRSVAQIVKRYAKKMGFLARQYAGHSLRSGFLTSAVEAHANIFQMKAQSRHKCWDVLSGYVQDQNLFDDHAGAGLLSSQKAESSLLLH